MHNILHTFFSIKAIFPQGKKRGGVDISSFLHQKQYFQVYNKCKIKHHIITDSFTQIQKQQKRVDNMNLKKIDCQLVTSTY